MKKLIMKLLGVFLIVGSITMMQARHPHGGHYRPRPYYRPNVGFSFGIGTPGYYGNPYYPYGPYAPYYYGNRPGVSFGIGSGYPYGPGIGFTIPLDDK